MMKASRTSPGRWPLGALLAASATAASCAHPGGIGGIHYKRVPSGAYAVVAEVRAKPGKEDQLREATLPLVAKVRHEPHNLLYFLHEDREAAGHFVFYEIFASQADFETHNATPHVQAWFARLAELADGDVQVVRMKILGNSPASTR